MKLRTLPSSGPGAGQMYSKGVERLWGSTEKKSHVGHRQLQNSWRKVHPIQLTWAPTAGDDGNVMLSGYGLVMLLSMQQQNHSSFPSHAEVPQDWLLWRHVLLWVVLTLTDSSQKWAMDCVCLLAAATNLYSITLWDNYVERLPEICILFLAFYW